MLARQEPLAPSSDRLVAGCCLFAGVFLLEFAHAAFGVHDLLFAGVKRMALRTYFDMQFLAQGGACRERIPAGANDLDFLVFRVNVGFHSAPQALQFEKRVRMI